MIMVTAIAFFWSSMRNPAMNCVYGYCCYARMKTDTRALQLNYRASGQRAPRADSKIGGHSGRATLNYNCAAVGSKKHQGHRRAQRGGSE